MLFSCLCLSYCLYSFNNYNIIVLQKSAIILKLKDPKTLSQVSATMACRTELAQSLALYCP